MDDLVLSEADEQAIREGQAAADLLESPVFLVAIERVRAQCAEHILTSKPVDREAREDLYNLSRGLSAVTEELIAIAALGTSTLDNATRPTVDEEVQEDPDQPADDYRE